MADQFRVLGIFGKVTVGHRQLGDHEKHGLGLTLVPVSNSNENSNENRFN